MSFSQAQSKSYISLKHTTSPINSQSAGSLRCQATPGQNLCKEQRGEIKAKSHILYNVKRRKGSAAPDSVEGSQLKVSQTHKQAVTFPTEAAIKHPEQVEARQECGCVITLLALYFPNDFCR